MKPQQSNPHNRATRATHLTSAIPLYHGNIDEDVESFINALDEAARISGCTDAEKADILHLRTAGEAKRYIRAYGKLRETTDYQYLVRKLLDEYRTRETTNVILTEMRNLYQQHGELVRVFEHKLQELGNRLCKAYAHPSEDMLQDTLKSEYERGQNSNAARGHVNEANTPRAILLDLIEVATREELREKQIYKPKHSAINAVNKSSKANLSNTQSKPDGFQCFNCGKVGHKARNCFQKQKRNDQTVCYNCGITGNVARDCRRPQKAENGKAPKAGAYIRRPSNNNGSPTFTTGPKKNDSAIGRMVLELYKTMKKVKPTFILSTAEWDKLIA
ncbi:uncharacterized protein LOC111087879 [Limulus polyphemus]|uniref:Uncharacterized protein LOC111087879 n=1 Tax=Limulus polyphemus TaxID=6850 RepID=A0ABM1T7J5_LIMPO|nr:uncharacterized protein LOC111087879 [Limulus polyphemus]